MATNKPMKKRLGEILIEEGVISDLQLTQALGDQKQWGGKIGEILLRLGSMTEEDLAFALQARLKVKWLSLKEMRISDAIIKLVPEETAKQLNVVPVGIKKTTLFIAMTDPTDLKTLDTLSFNLGSTVKPVIATQSDIKWAIAKYYDGVKEEAQAMPDGQVVGFNEVGEPQEKETPQKESLKKRSKKSFFIKCIL
jgi:type IV pilus assembly protein PilB